MTDKCGWIVRLYKADNYNTTVDKIGNFTQYHNRRNDDVIVFSGMYGIDDYMIWYIHKNVGNYDFSTVNIDLKLYLEGDLGKPFWHKQYKVLDVKYSTKESRYILYAMSLDSVKLKTKLVDYQSSSLNYSGNRSAYSQKPTQKELSEAKKNMSEEEYKKLLKTVKRGGLLVDMLEKGKEKIFKVEYMESQYEKDLKNFEYRYFTFDEEWTVEDFINYIADQNEFEWYIRNGVLYIGNECKAIRGFNTTRQFDLEKDNIPNTAWFKKYSGVTRPMVLMSHISETWRCIWCKHMAGKSGGLSKGCFTKIGIGTLDKENYLRTLEGENELRLASKLLKNKPYSHYVTIGNILKDNGIYPYIDEISIQKNKQLYKVNEPSDILIDRGDDSQNSLLQTKQRVARSTPYLDANAGLFFPAPLLEEEEIDIEGLPTKGVPPNMVLFQVEGKEEASIAGPFVYGNSDRDFKDFKIPFKGRKDFRLSFPIGWTMYVDGDYGKTLLQCDSVPTWTDTTPKFPYPGNSDYNPDGQEKTYIYMRPLNTEASTTRNEISLNAGLGNTDEEIGSKLKVMSDNGLYFITKDYENDKEVTIEANKNKIILTAKKGDSNINKITIDAENLKIDVESQETLNIISSDDTINIITHGNDVNVTSDSGKIKVEATQGNVEINCNSSGTVNINSGGESVSLVGHKHPFSGHTHPNVGPAIPGPPNPTQSTTPNIQGETDKHSKHLRCVQG